MIVVVVLLTIQHNALIACFLWIIMKIHIDVLFALKERVVGILSKTGCMTQQIVLTEISMKFVFVFKVMTMI
jgi:hypothetical protein